MIDLSHKNEWQYICPETGLVFPWYTKPCLDEIVTWDLSDKVVFEYGCGASTLWWRNKAFYVRGVESNKEYAEAVAVDFIQDNSLYVTAPLNYDRLFDIIIIDGLYRESCLEIALTCIKDGGKIIFDNWMQPSVEVQSEETQRLLVVYPHTIYKEPTHPDWQTLVATIQ